MFLELSPELWNYEIWRQILKETQNRNMCSFCSNYDFKVNKDKSRNNRNSCNRFSSKKVTFPERRAWSVLTAIRRHVRINRISLNNYADTATRDDTRGGTPPGKFPWCTIINGTPISISADISELMPPAPPRRIFPNDYTDRLSCLSCPLSPFSFLLARSTFVRLVRFAGPRTKWRARRLGWQMSRDYAASRFESFRSDIWMLHACRLPPTRHRPLSLHWGNKHSRLSFIRRTARPPLPLPLCYETSSDLCER